MINFMIKVINFMIKMINFMIKMINSMIILNIDNKHGLNDKLHD